MGWGDLYLEISVEDIIHPPKHTIVGKKKFLRIKGRSLLLSISSCASLSDMGFHELHTLFLGLYIVKDQWEKQS